MSKPKSHFTNLCKIADNCSHLENSDFEYMRKRWKVNGVLNSTEIIKACDKYKRSGFEIITHNDSLYVAFINDNRVVSSKEQYFIQRALFLLIFKDYKSEADLSVVIGTRYIEQPQSLRVVKNCVIEKLYEALRNQNDEMIEEEEEEEALNLPSNFLPKLCRYQERTVRWLLKREKSRKKLRHFFKRLEAKDNTTIVYKNTLCTQFETVEPSNIELPPGGILADEMGLGKTVELLALILLHKREECTFRLADIVPYTEEENIPKKKLRITDDNVYCICTKKTKEQLIECCICHIRQHEICVCKHNSDHDAAINDPYMCPSCWKTYTETNCLVESAATLIVTPNTIRKQWFDEIHRHTSSKMRVYIYEGVSKGDWINPRQLSDYDVVLTNYETLRREVFHTTEHDSDRVLRRRPRSMRLYTPLLMINWFRCCLDEAQMVETDASKMAALVRTLPAIHRWAVSGTPIQRSIDDLYPLVRFIGLEESINAEAWDTLVKDFVMNFDDKNLAKCRLVEILRNFMWRTCKEHVLDELPIPPQTEIIHRVTLSDLELLYYTQQHESCELECHQSLNEYIERTYYIECTSSQILKIMLKPLFKIRQCCTIPVVSANNRSKGVGGVMQKQFLQPKELHAHMKMTNERECKSELRSMAVAYNGCAAIHIIKKNYKEAVKNYEAVLKLARDCSDEKNISVDSLLQIHALHNILEVRNISPALALTILPQEKFNEYETQLNALEWKYIEPYASQLLKMETAFMSALQTLETNKMQLNEDLTEFMSIILDIEDQNMQSQLIAKILDDCIGTFGSTRIQSATSLRGVLLLIVSWYDKLMSEQNNILKSLEELKFYSANIKPKSQVSDEVRREITKFISTVYDCHLMELRKLKNNTSDNEQQDDDELDVKHTISRKKRRRNQISCKLCKLRDLLNNFECLLFKKSIDVLTNQVEGDENPQLEIAMIKIIFGFLKPKRAILANDIERHWAVLQNMQQVCKKAIKYWIEIEFTVKAYDELDMCKMRMTLSDDKDEMSKYQLASYELEFSLTKQQIILREAQQNFVTKMGRLKYIRHLESNADTGPCPICQSDDEIRHIVLECGHQMCLPCFKNLRQYKPGQILTCSVCRNVQNTYRVYFVNVLANMNPQEEQFQIYGDFSSKITYIVRLVMKLQLENERNAIPSTSSMSNFNHSDQNVLKILIFSQWESILEVLANAFHENNISYLLYSNVNTIENFKKQSLGITCLLMPLSRGCKGLNLIEATHVFLVEPILNPSEEQQAIGRVHRFGQTRPTTVHRFIVNDTIEENIEASQKSWDFNNMNFGSLFELFKLRNNVSSMEPNDILAIT